MYNLYRSRDWPKLIKIFEETSITQQLLQLEHSDFYDALSLLKQRITWVTENRQIKEQTKTSPKPKDQLDQKKKEKKRTDQDTSDSSLIADTSTDSERYEAIEIKDHRSLLERTLETMGDRNKISKNSSEKDAIKETAEEK